MAGVPILSTDSIAIHVKAMMHKNGDAIIQMSKDQHPVGASICEGSDHGK